MVQNEVQWAISKYCSQCSYTVINDIRLSDGYFMCRTKGYITFRAYLYSTDATVDLMFFKTTLTNWLNGQGTDKTITINQQRYSVEAGPCGVTVPLLHAPECSTGSSPSSAADTVTVGVSSTQYGSAVSAASVFATMFFMSLFIVAFGLIWYFMAARNSR